MFENHITLIINYTCNDFSPLIMIKLFLCLDVLAEKQFFDNLYNLDHTKYCCYILDYQNRY